MTPEDIEKILESGGNAKGQSDKRKPWRRPAVKNLLIKKNSASQSDKDRCHKGKTYVTVICQQVDHLFLDIRHPDLHSHPLSLSIPI
jgi:hypothetical protein